jgi:XTP/dITP diphosphohydrolase
MCPASRVLQPLVLASNNAKKLTEMAALLAPLGLELIPQGRLCVPEADEPHHTFLENALAKARHAARLTGLPALADDSGLCVDALRGEPGVHSARYAREADARIDATHDRDDQDARNNRKLLAVLENVSNRRARFVSVLVLVRHADDPQPIVAEGEWVGEILPAPQGENGFGYDPLFLDLASGKASAELSPTEKNNRSHRGHAMNELIRRLTMTPLVGASANAMPAERI